MTTEDLLKPRYKILAPGYPYCPWEVGSILYLDSDGELFSKEAGYPLSRRMVMKTMADNYPNIFEPLPWWKDRKVDEMPEYVKVIETPDHKLMAGMVMKLTWLNSGWGRSDKGEVFPYTNCFEPATLDDYNAYLQTTNKLKDGKD